MASPTAATAADAADASPQPQLRSIESDHVKAPSPLRTVLTQARTDIWAAQPIFFSALFTPLRDFVFDPALAISCVLLPPLLGSTPNLDKLMAKCLTYTLFLPIKTVYGHVPQETKDRSLRSTSRDVILHTGPNVAKMPKYEPPSDLRSAFQGGISFVVSAVGDIIGVLTNPQKMSKWTGKETDNL